MTRLVKEIIFWGRFKLMNKKQKATASVIMCIFIFLSIYGVCAMALTPVRIQELLIKNITTSSDMIKDTGANKLVDGNLDSTWVSSWVNENDEKCSEWIVIEFEELYNVDRLELFPKCEIKNSSTIYSGFPKDFKIQYSIDGSLWTDVKGQLYINYSPSAREWQQLVFGKTVIAKYIKVCISKKTPERNGFYLAMLNELSLFGSEYAGADVFVPQKINYTPSVSSEFNPAVPSKQKLNDDIVGNETWTSQGGSAESNPMFNEWIVMNVGQVKKIGTIQIFPRVAAGIMKVGNFPVDFKFQYSTDGTNWNDILGQNYIQYPTPMPHSISFSFNKAVDAQYIKMLVTKKGVAPDSPNRYLVEISEIQIFTGADIVEAPTNPISSSISTSSQLVSQASSRNNTASKSSSNTTNSIKSSSNVLEITAQVSSSNLSNIGSISSNSEISSVSIDTRSESMKDNPTKFNNTIFIIIAVIIIIACILIGVFLFKK